jgi:sugar O-acyltransferase (sialic acid O-acetyltransferase NeuD family)
MLLYGAGGHAKVVWDCLYAQQITVHGVFDDYANPRFLPTIPVLGAYQAHALPDELLIIAIGNNTARRQLASAVRHRFGQAIHPSATVSRFVQGIGKGTVILHNAVIQIHTLIGDHCIVNTSANVDHDCVIGDFVHISPNATLCGNVTVGEGTHIGASATAIPGVSIGKWCVVGAGSVVTRDIPDFSVAVGVPAKVIKPAPLM